MTTHSETVKASSIDAKVWKKLGINQAFDLLLVRECLDAPDLPAVLCARIGANLADSAKKFWEMSFSELARGLQHRQVLIHEESGLKLHPKFADKLKQTIDTVESGRSHVAPSNGVSLESIEARAKAREIREQNQKKPAKTAARPAAVRPAKRPAANTAPADVERPVSSRATNHTSVAPPLATPKEDIETLRKRLFTSIRINRLFDRLEHSTLSVKQLGEKLELSRRDLDRFMSVCIDADLIRLFRDDLVELHWRGREYARTVDVERRMSVLALVKELRSACVEDLAKL